MRISTVLKVTLAWLPFFVLWALFIVVYGSGSPRAGVISSLTAIGGAALLGVGVWWFSGKYPWPDHLQPSFYFVHLLVGTIYSAAWVAIEYGVESIRSGASFLEMLFASSVLGWQLLMGLWLYGLVAGVSYAVRIRRSLREQERAAARAEALAAQAQLRTLRAQLNPHFLFNALHSLTALIAEEPRRAEEAVERLGELLRYALDETGDEKVPLQDEWEFTRHYLDLERLRLNSRLKIEADFAPGTLSCLVPSFTLQPLVENAVQHSIATRPEGGLIQIRAALEAELLVVTVRDDGPGADMQQASDSDGHGLRALEQRLQAIYGGAARLIIETAPGEGFMARIMLPQSTPEAAGAR